MANLGILNGAEFYLYDVEVYDKILYGKINFKSSQVSSITSKGYKILSNGFYGINRTELIKQFIKYLAKMDINVDSDSFLLNEVTDKRIKKEGTYVNDPHIFSSSASQYDAQSTNKITTNTNAKKEVKVAKPILDIDIINKDNMYKTTLNLKDYNLGDGTKTLYAFTQPQLKDKIESYFKSFKLDYDVNLNLVKPTQDVGKVLIDVTLNKDKVIGEVDLSHINLPNIKAEATTKQGLLDAIINQLKSQNLTGKLNWGKIVDNTKKVGDKKMANMTKSGLKSFATKLSKAIKTIGMNQDEIEARVFSMVPNATYSDPTLAGDKVDLSFILPWDVSSSITKTDIKAIAKEKSLPLWDINVTKAEPWLYITDEIGDGIRIEIAVDVHFSNDSDDTEDYYSLDLITMDIPLVANDEPEVAPQQANTFKSKLKPKNAEVMESMGKFYDDGYSSTVGSDAGLDVVMKGDKVDVTIRLFPSASQDDVRLQELNQMKDTLRAIENLPTTAIKASTSLTDDVVKCNVSIKQFDAFIFKLLSCIQGGLKSYYALHLFNKDALDSYGTKPLSKKPLPTTTMNSIAVRDEFIKQVLHGMDCTLINISEDDFRADSKAFHQVKVNKIKNLGYINLDFPNQKMCIATIVVINSDDIGIINANMSEEHQVKFNGKIGTIRMKVNKDDINSITDIVNLIKELRSADIAVKNNDGGNTMNNNVLETLKGDFAKIFNITKEDSQQLVGKLDNIELSIAVLNVGLSVSIKGIPTFEFVKFVSAGYSEKNKVLTRLYADTATDKIKSIFKLCKEVNDSQAKSMDKTEAIMRIELLLKQNTMDATQQAMNIALANNISQQELMDIMNGKLTATKSVKVPNIGVAHKSLAAEVNDHDLFINSDTFKTVKNILLSDGFNQTDINGYVSFIKDNTQHGYSVWIRLRKNNKFDAHITVTNTDHLKVLIDSLKGLKFTKTDDLTIKFANDVTFSKIMVNSTLKTIKKFDSSLDVFTVANTPQPDKQDLGGVEDMGKVTPKAPASSSPVVNDIEPTDNGIDPKRKTEINYKASAVKDPDHKAQLDRMRAYVKKIADVVDADNDFTLRFLEEPKEFTKYKLPTVGVGLFYYGNKSIVELEQSPLYKKVYRGRGLSILRKFFKTTDQNGEKCLLVLFVDAQYAKQTKAKLIKESFEQNTKISINGKQYTIKAIYEGKFAIETIVGAMYIDMDSELIDLTINEE